MSSTRWGVLAATVCVTVLGGGCTGMLVDGRPIRDRHVLAGRAENGGELTFAELHYTGSYISTSAHLEPLRAVLVPVHPGYRA